MTVLRRTAGALRRVNPSTDRGRDGVECACNGPRDPETAGETADFRFDRGRGFLLVEPAVPGVTRQLDEVAMFAFGNHGTRPLAAAYREDNPKTFNELLKTRRVASFAQAGEACGAGPNR
jgi:hypothetical protein